MTAKKGASYRVTERMAEISEEYPGLSVSQTFVVMRESIRERDKLIARLEMEVNRMEQVILNVSMRSEAEKAANPVEKPTNNLQIKEFGDAPPKDMFDETYWKRLKETLIKSLEEANRGF